MPETQQNDETRNDNSQLIEGETATVTVSPFGPRAKREYSVDLDGRMALGTVKQTAREKAHSDGLDVFRITAVNGKLLSISGGGFAEFQPDSYPAGGERP